MTLAIITPAAADPVSLAEAKLFLRVNVTDDDALITALISAATDWVQKKTGRQLVTATLQQQWDSFPSVWYPPRIVSQATGQRLYFAGMTAALLTLDRLPVQSVTSVTYYDTNNAQQTVSSATYFTDLVFNPPRIVPVDAWPSVYLGRPNAVQCTFVAGYGVAGTVPEMLRTAVKMLVSHWYENREPVVSKGGIPKEVPMTIEAICGLFETQVIR